MPEDQLHAADPARGLGDDVAEAVVSAMWQRAPSAQAARRRRRRWRVVLPVGIAVAVVTTGAAVGGPLWLAVGEAHTPVAPHLQLPLAYTTESGQRVDCEYAVHVSDATVGEVLAQIDTDGIGQEIHDHAVAHPFEPGPDFTWEDGDSAEARARISFELAVVPVLEGRLPAELRGLDVVWGGTHTCTGPFR